MADPRPHYDQAAYLAMSPQQYLRDGFRAGDAPRRELLTVYAVGMAYQFRRDGVPPDLARALADELQDAALGCATGVVALADALPRLRDDALCAQFPPLQAWLAGALDAVRTRQDLEALAAHAAAIAEQLILLELA